MPPAVRASAPGWRDPRLWVGVAIVAASVLVGVRVLASADDTIAVWAVRDDVGAGDRLTADDLVTTRVRFGDSDALDRYFVADDPLPDPLRVQRGLGAGELLPRAAIGPDVADTVEVSLPVGQLRLPPSVGPGSVVDVYVSDAAGPGPGDDRGQPDPGPALGGVSVVDAPLGEADFGGAGDRQLVLAVATEAAPAFYALLASLTDPVISVARR
ncbi:flagellar protein FlgA [soil metagenome]